MKIQYDKKTTPHKFKVGDHVMLWYPYKINGLSKVWQPNWKGPFQIFCLVGECNCILINGAGILSPTFHVNQLKLVLPPNKLDIPQPIIDQTRSETQREMPCETVPAEVFLDVTEDSDIAEISNNRSESTQHQPLIQQSWCELDTDSILPNHTRSGKQ